MPKHKTICKIPENTNQIDIEQLKNKINEARTFFDKKLASIDKIEDIMLQQVCIFSLIDCLAQESGGYKIQNKKGFCDFVKKHQKQCEYIEEVEPITLYYRVEKYVEEKVKIDVEILEKEISLKDFEDFYGVPVKNIIPYKKSEEILNYLEKNKENAFAKQVREEHKLISLIYRMRSKAVHEMLGLGVAYGNNIAPQEPYYMSMYRGYQYNDNIVSDDVIELVIPNIFLRNILVDCIDGYLNDCLTEKRLPFSNNKITRTCRLTWYDNV